MFWGGRSANFAGASVNMLTDDTETMSNASEIVLGGWFRHLYAGGGNDKIIGGRNVDTFYGQVAMTIYTASEATTSLTVAIKMIKSWRPRR